MALVPAHNPTDTAVIVDPAGRQVAGGDWGVVDDALDQVAEAVAAGRLHLYRAASLDDGPGQNADAVAAAHRSIEAQGRLEAFSAAGDAADELAVSALGMTADEVAADRPGALRALALSAVPLPGTPAPDAAPTPAPADGEPAPSA